MSRAEERRLRTVPINFSLPPREDNYNQSHGRGRRNNREFYGSQEFDRYINVGGGPTEVFTENRHSNNVPDHVEVCY